MVPSCFPFVFLSIYFVTCPYYSLSKLYFLLKFTFSSISVLGFMFYSFVCWYIFFHCMYFVRNFRMVSAPLRQYPSILYAIFCNSLRIFSFASFCCDSISTNELWFTITNWLLNNCSSSLSINSSSQSGNTSFSCYWALFSSLIASNSISSPCAPFSHC